MLSIKNKRLGIVIPTLNAREEILQCLTPLLASPLMPEILVVDSSSTDGTVSLVKSLGVQVRVIQQEHFNHGLTREWARRQLGTEIVVMMTPDAFVTDEHMLEKLIAPLLSGEASVSYARQVPKKNTSFFEAFHRHFLYGEKSYIRSQKDLDLEGTLFCSNSCAAYLNSALDEIGGFKAVLIGEDTLATQELLETGHSVAYVAEATVEHSHRYTLWEEFQRYFDTGMARRNSDDSPRGRKYAKELLKTTLKKKLYLFPYACAIILAKWLGWKMGRMSLPHALRRVLSGHKNYWEVASLPLPRK